MKLEPTTPPKKLFDGEMCVVEKQLCFAFAKDVLKLPLKCYICKCDITVDNISAVVNNPDRIICTKIHCNSEFITEEEFRHEND